LVTPLIRRIVVPVDFGEASERAIDYAAGLARLMGASLHLIHILEEPVFASGPIDCCALDTPALCERLHVHARVQLASTAVRLRGDGAHPVTSEIRRGAPAESIVRAAADHRADLVILGTRGRLGLSHMLLGSVAEQVARTASCPALIVRAPGAVGVPVRHSAKASVSGNRESNNPPARRTG
jgi:universal stress protein A